MASSGATEPERVMPRQKRALGGHGRRCRAGKRTSDKLILDRKPEQNEGVLARIGGKAFLGERTALAKAPRWEYSWGVGGQSDERV